jgi:hypothetical protein
MILLGGLLCGQGLGAQVNNTVPHIGYLYPAGLQQGTTVKVLCSGQFLRNPQSVTVTGQGVRARVVTFIRPGMNLMKEQRTWIQQRLAYEQTLRLAELRREPVPPDVTLPESPATESLPKHPLLEDLDGRSLRELAHIREILFAPRQKQQVNRQLAECVILEVTVDAEAAPGARELRLVTGTGITNPMVFQVGQAPEVRELEPNNQQAYMPLRGLPRDFNLPEPAALTVPVVLNGQILPGDVDRFRLHANQGSRLLIKAHARTLIPYLADAVPGWFQAVVALYDDQGKEVAYADDDRFNPDPVLSCTLPKTGDYELEIRDAIYRGREDFVYRVEVSESSSVRPVAPELEASFEGLTEFVELPAEEVMDVTLPIVGRGCIDPAGDTDVYRFQGHAGDMIAMEVESRSLDAPLDSLVRLIDHTGKVIAWNDDYVMEEAHLYKDTAGLITHHADSYLMTRLPGDGLYDVQIMDAQRHGGPDFVYRLRIAQAQGDFALRTGESGLSVSAGGSVKLTVHALRKDGFTGAIDIDLCDPSHGFVLRDAQIPADKDQAVMTLAAPRGRFKEPLNLHLQGTATIQGKTITRDIVPADDVMQAYLYRHLVPAKTLTVLVRNTMPNRPRQNRAK